ncbi:hypothetical protein M404DRAFT_28965 [Pisolithus tinctorius Marx 270]|uniref:Uncharacterized protein n=1 Tax=Pisolithus tinctorius Marx 270 TaxID=870435 RepID=A0A0C3JUT9_PISTI|nr:hypothetical protein M404DRAFT_28965 [Pisolithus tinctorius Marx 270]
MVPQPEESLEAIYEWAVDWDQTWAGIYSWWKYIDENEISIPKQNEVIPVVIAIADLRWPEGQRRFLIDDVFKDYQEQVKERVCLEAERLAKAPSMCTWGQAARGEGQDHAPEDTEGNPSRGAACSTGEGSGSRSKGKGKQKATSEEDELADDVDNDKGDGEPSASTKGPCTAGDNEPCEMCAQADLVCVREPESSCKWCRKAKHKCLRSRGVGRKRKNSSTVGEAGPSHKQVKSIMTSKVPPAKPATRAAKKLTLKILARKQQPDPTPTCSPLPEPTPSPHDPSPTPRLFFHRATPTPGPSTIPVPVDEPPASPLIDELQVEIETFFVTATGLLEEPGDIEVLAQSDTPSATEIPEVEYPCEQSTAHIVEHLQVLEARAEEFKLEQVHWLLGMLVRQVTHRIETAWARQEELRRLKDDLHDL